MKQSRWWILLLLLVTLGVNLPHAWAFDTYRLIKAVPVPDQRLTSFDISWVDSAAQRYYFADRNNKSVDVFRTSPFFVFNKHIPGFCGLAPFSNPKCGDSGPNGVLAIPGRNELWVGDGDSTVKVVDLTTGTIVDTIDTGGSRRTDELAYNAVDQMIMAANDRGTETFSGCPGGGSTPPSGAFFTFISTKPGHHILGHLCYPAARNDGLEQPVWDHGTHTFYDAIPITAAHPGGEVLVIDVQARTGKTFGVDRCNPHGLALGPGNQLLLGCSTAAFNSTDPAQTLIIDKTNGNLLASIPVGGSDEVWFNPGDNHYYLAANGMTSNGKTTGTLTPVLGIVDAGPPIAFIDKVPTAVGAHSVAADSVSNQIFVPVGSGAVEVYGK